MEEAASSLWDATRTSKHRLGLICMSRFHNPLPRTLTHPQCFAVPLVFTQLRTSDELEGNAYLDGNAVASAVGKPRWLFACGKTEGERAPGTVPPVLAGDRAGGKVKL